MLEGIGAVVPVGVHHRHGGGKGILTFVVVGDDDLQPQSVGMVGLGHGGDAAVHRDDHRDPLVFQFLHRLPVQAVALLQPVGDIGYDFAPLPAEKIGEQAGGGDAVHVIVSVDRQSFPLVQSGLQPPDGFVHILHGHGVTQGGFFKQKPPGRLSVGPAPGGKDLGAQGRNACRQKGALPAAGGELVPLLVLHDSFALQIIQIFILL